MPNLLEWMPLGREPGCREAAMDPQRIILFGQTIGVISNHTGAGADAEVLKPTSASPPWDTAPTSRQDGTEKKGVVEKLISVRSSSGDEFLQPPKFSKLVAEYGAPNIGSRLSDDSSEGGYSDELKDLGDGDHSHSVGNDKHLPKPDKVVSCPRCDSLDTKFCYYNNYNVNQPRHFCKNCQRYWTAGGTLRNVPVGAGRRKNKHGTGGPQRENCSEASAPQLFSGASGSPTSQKGTSYKHSQSKRMPGQSSPMRSPGSASSLGQDSGITMSPPPYSFHNGRLPFHPYSCSQGFMTSGIEASAVGSSDSSSTLGQRLQRLPSGNGFDKDCSRSSLSGLMQEAPNLGAMQTVFTAPMPQHRESSATYRSVASSDFTSSWVGNDGPVRAFNGDYPNGYHLDWDGKQHPVPSSQGGASFSTPALRNYHSGPTPPPTSSRNPAPAAQWASNVGYVSHPQMTTSGWLGDQSTGPCVSSAGQQQQQQPVALHTTLGKRGVAEGDRLDGSQAAKALRTDECSRSRKSAWPMLGRNPSEVNATVKLFQPKLELAEQKDSFMGRLFINSAAARLVPFPVTT